MPKQTRRTEFLRANQCTKQQQTYKNNIKNSTINKLQRFV